MKSFWVRDLGVQSYEETLKLQKELLDGISALGWPSTLLLVEHPPVLTLGANFHEENLIHPREWYAEKGISVVDSDRGGDITYHGPGQLVAYPIFSLSELEKISTFGSAG